MDEPLSQNEIGARRRRRMMYLAAAGLALVVALYGVTRLGQAAPAVSGEGLWIDTVREGDILRELHGIGELVPDDDASRWVSAEVEGRIDRKLLEPGAAVRSDTVLFQLSNPDIAQAAAGADLDLDAATAALSTLEATLQIELLALKSAVAAIESDRAQAALQARVDSTLASDGLLSANTAQISRVRLDALTARMTLEAERILATERSLTTRLASQRSEVESRRTFAALKHRDLSAMTVRAGMDGVLQDVPVEVGQRVTRNANLARVVDPNRLKARLRIPEAQTHELRLGQTVRVDTRNGVVPGRVSRIAPSAQNGTVAVDVDVTGALPEGARLDMTIDGTIEIDRLSGVRHLGRPASGQTAGDITLFKVDADGTRAQRVRVRVGVASANRVQILDGDLRAGDRVVLSDTSSWGQETVRLR